MFNEEITIKPTKFSHNRLIKFIAYILAFSLLCQQKHSTLVRDLRYYVTDAWRIGNE